MTKISLPARAYANHWRSKWWNLLTYAMGRNLCANYYYEAIKGKTWVGYDGTVYP
jgi:hypothetical protein